MHAEKNSQPFSSQAAPAGFLQVLHLNDALRKRYGLLHEVISEAESFSIIPARHAKGPLLVVANATLEILSASSGRRRRLLALAMGKLRSAAPVAARDRARQRTRDDGGEHIGD